jgi:sigma-B regulation protein RsbU (phosphoserine phosphatase)
VIGGDHYDFLTLADGRQAVIVADVSGEALSGALYMARLGSVLKQAAVRNRRAAELLEDVNRVLYAELEAGMFVTMAALVLEPRSGALELASAGHPAPLVRRRDGRVEILDAPPGPALGTMSDPSYQSAKHQLGNGECALLYTDGLSEATDAAGASFGLERVRAILAEADGAEATITKLRESLARFVASQPQSDDLTLVAMQRS